MDAPQYDKSSQGTSRPAAVIRPWVECEVFCIHSYAGNAGPRCGWRGLRRETLCNHSSGTRRCPACGRATVMEIRPQG